MNDDLSPETTREVLLLILDDLDEQRQAIQQTASAASVANMSAKLDKVHDLLVDVLRGDESRQRAFDQARRSDAEERSKLAQRVRNLEGLRIAPNGAR